MSGAAAGAAAAAAAARQRMLSEEEEMTTYGSHDLAQDWEFKIVRANTGVFRNPATLERLLEEEAQAGWTMVEKFDNSRIRFKRLRQARTQDANRSTGIDPYRVHYGMSPALFVLVTVMAVFGVTAGIMLSVFFIVNAVVK